MVEIRTATVRDASDILALGKLMRAEGPHFMKLDFSDEKAQLVISRLIANGGALVACDKGKIIGMFLFAVIEHLWGYDKIATDIAIYVDKEHRGGSAFVRLLRAFEAVTADRVRMWELGTSAGVENERIADLFTAMGYYRHGIGTRKEVNHVQR